MPAHNCVGGPQYPPAVERQIATSNATVNAFVKGTRQRPWMTAGAPKPSHRQVPPRPPQSTVAQAVQQQHPQSVLPSPAPSDEPSPAVSNPHDSPNPNPASLPDPQSMSASTPIHPLTDARFVHDPTIDTSAPHTHDAFGAGGSLSVPSTYMNNSPFQANAQLPPAVHHPVVNNIGRSASSSASFSASFSGVPARHTSFDEHTSTATAVHGAPPSKRRKMDLPLQTSYIPLKYSLFIPKIDQHIQDRGGEQALTSNVERPRIQLLKEACTQEDGFFLALHQLYCIWSESPSEAHGWIQYPSETIDKAFSIIEQILKKNQQVAPLTQAWFSRFPEPIARLINPATTYLPMVNQASKFLEKLANNFQALSKSSVERNYPYLNSNISSSFSCNRKCHSTTNNYCIRNFHSNTPKPSSKCDYDCNSCNSISFSSISNSFSKFGSRHDISSRRNCKYRSSFNSPPSNSYPSNSYPSNKHCSTKSCSSSSSSSGSSNRQHFTSD
ncbi:hypothetical protein B0T25DRAFT_599774 [Lasiosphaeria hispida]|uniref:Uncharacterized protein n=1 Tax=Lasiosphaeria hispida TaxID=260671 RepID=A0AAJ0HPB8_9PEZI|nr:hypothetical protein B0T25DRAFT_599774 [Lasiosphaeria hispida]